MRIAIDVDPGRVRRWQELVRDRLSAGAEARFRAAPAGPGPSPGAAAVLRLERAGRRRARPPLFERAAASSPWWAAGEGIDLAVDLSGREDAALDPSGPAVLRPVYDGRASEAALLRALLAGAVPEVAVVDGRTGMTLARGRPAAFEDGGGLTGALDGILSRAAVLIEGLIRAPRRPVPGPAPDVVEHRPRSPAAAVARRPARGGARAAASLALRTPHWRVGWRLHEGPGVAERRNLGGPAWRTLPDPGHRFFADPFPAVWDGRAAILFEDFDHRAGKGTISAVEVAGGVPGPPVPVLEEPWHLSYPFLVADGGSLFMVPEASLSGEVALYRCLDFPRRWERCATLLSGVEAADATLLRHGGRWWLFAVTREGRGGYSDTLRIWHAPRLAGPYAEHALRPVLVDAAAARPAGAVIADGGALLRPFQDCSEGYGRALGLARIDVLDPERYSETVVARLRPGPDWPGRRIHTLNRWGPLECIDGSAVALRGAALRSLAARVGPLRP